MLCYVICISRLQFAKREKESYFRILSSINVLIIIIMAMYICAVHGNSLDSIQIRTIELRALCVLCECVSVFCGF